MNDLAISQELNYDKHYYSDEQIEQIESLNKSIAKLESKFQTSKKVKRLIENDDFKDVVLNTLLGSDMIETASELSNPYISDEREQDILSTLRSIRHFSKLLNNTISYADKAEQVLKDEKQLLTNILSYKEDNN